MSDQTTYDVAIVGYGPTGVTAANLLGGMGLRVLVVERDADIYARARAISTDEEVMRIWQSIGLADRLQRDMLAGLALTFVDDRQRILATFKPHPHGHGHPPQQFIFQPALEQVLRDGVDRFPNVEVRLEHECLRTREEGDSVDLLLHDVRADALVHARARYVIAADGGASPTRGLLGVGFEGRTYEDRWVVIDTKMKKTWPNY
ncbi:MAG: FAD-dependent monooxygenase, partial [Myxococcota bacterium]|nr:FAD-dependent monooxygenase [Myxococcota bacterium]